MPRICLGRAVTILIGLLVAGLFALVYANYQRDIRQARERISVGSQIAETPCGIIEYAAAGDGPPILVVHGSGGGFDQGMDFAAPLIQRAAVIGASAGAPSAMQFALRHPQHTSALVLHVPAAYVPRPGGAPPMKTPAGLEFLFDTALKSDFLCWDAPRLACQTVIRTILATPPAVVESASADERARVAQVLDHILRVSPRRLGLLNDAAITSTLPCYELERIAVPTLILSAADDLFGTYDGARYSAEHIPRARFIGYPSGGHLWVGRQQEVMSAITAFLK